MKLTPRSSNIFKPLYYQCQSCVGIDETARSPTNRGVLATPVRVLELNLKKDFSNRLTLKTGFAYFKFSDKKIL